jgi:hypothetical protein
VAQHADGALADGAPHAARRRREIAEEGGDQRAQLAPLEIADQRRRYFVDRLAHCVEQWLVGLWLRAVVDQLLCERCRVLATLARLDEARHLAKFEQRRTLRSTRRVACLDRLRAQLHTFVQLENDALGVTTNQRLQPNDYSKSISIEHISIEKKKSINYH